MACVQGAVLVRVMACVQGAVLMRVMACVQGAVLVQVMACVEGTVLVWVMACVWGTVLVRAMACVQGAVLLWVMACMEGTILLWVMACVQCVWAQRAGVGREWLSDSASYDYNHFAQGTADHWHETAQAHGQTKAECRPNVKHIRGKTCKNFCKSDIKNKTKKLKYFSPCPRFLEKPKEPPPVNSTAWRKTIAVVMGSLHFVVRQLDTLDWGLLSLAAVEDQAKHTNITFIKKDLRKYFSKNRRNVWKSLKKRNEHD